MGECDWAYDRLKELSEYKGIANAKWLIEQLVGLLNKLDVETDNK